MICLICLIINVYELKSRQIDYIDINTNIFSLFIPNSLFRELGIVCMCDVYNNLIAAIYARPAHWHLWNDTLMIGWIVASL